LLLIATGEYFSAGLVGVSIRPASLSASGCRPENQLGIFQALVLRQPHEHVNVSSARTKLNRAITIDQHLILAVLYQHAVNLIPASLLEKPYNRVVNIRIALYLINSVQLNVNV
jgi:hypothetical protein